MSTPGTAVPPLDWPHYGIGFVPAVKRVFQKYATFTGRASRGEFWWWYLGYTIITMVLYFLTLGLGLATAGESGQFGAGGVIFGILLGLWFLATIVPTIAVTIRRLHDAGFSGWFYLLTLVGVGIVVIILCALETSPKAVQYGPPVPEGYGPGGYPNAAPGYAPPPQA